MSVVEVEDLARPTAPSTGSCIAHSSSAMRLSVRTSRYPTTHASPGDRGGAFATRWGLIGARSRSHRPRDGRTLNSSSAFPI